MSSDFRDRVEGRITADEYVERLDARVAEREPTTITHRWRDHNYLRVNSVWRICPCGATRRWWQFWR